jgi:hypothetical protein
VPPIFPQSPNRRRRPSSPLVPQVDLQACPRRGHEPGPLPPDGHVQGGAQIARDPSGQAPVVDQDRELVPLELRFVYLPKGKLGWGMGGGWG